MPSANTILRAAELAGLYFLLVLCSPCLCLRFVTRSRRRRRRGCMLEPILLPYPSPLSTDRIDIGRDQPPSEQPPTCHLLHLPAELRDLILEMAVGNRLVHLHMVPNQGIDALVMQSTCYAPSEEPDTPNALLFTAEKIPVALLLSCRQVYLEALPIIHQRNIFYFYLEDFQPTIQCSLGEYCLPNIRSVYLHHSYREGRQTRRWDPVFLTLQQMHLTALTVEFEILEWTELHPNSFSVDNAWCRGLLAIRDLRTLDIFFRYGNPADNPMHRETIIQTLRELMIGPDADEKYGALLAERDRINT